MLLIIPCISYLSILLYSIMFNIPNIFIVKLLIFQVVNIFHPDGGGSHLRNKKIQYSNVVSYIYIYIHTRTAHTHLLNHFLYI